jgi:biopolymer transport protein TolR
MAMFSRRSSNNSRSSNMIAEINVTPMVDVMLVLLIVFMITSPLMVAGISVDLPETSAAPLAGQEEPLSVTVDADGNIYIQDNKVKRGNLLSKLQVITEGKKDTRIFVRGDKTVNYGKIMEVVADINAAGFNKVALLTDTVGG